MSPTLSEFVKLASHVEPFARLVFHLLVESLDELALVNVLFFSKIHSFSDIGDYLATAADADCFAPYTVLERCLIDHRHRWLSGLNPGSLFDCVDFDHLLYRGGIKNDRVGLRNDVLLDCRGV